MKYMLLFFASVIPTMLSAQEEPVQEKEGSVVETKIGGKLNWNFGRSKQYLLSPSFKSVHNNRKKGDSWVDYQGMSAELYFSMPVFKYLNFFANVGLDLSETSTSHTSFSTGVNSGYAKGRFSVFGEFKYSTDRSLHYVDRERDPYFKYKVGGGVYVIEKIWKATAHVTLPHCLKENAITGISLEGGSDFTVTKRFGINVSFEWSDTFASGRDYFCPQLSAVFFI